MQKSKLMRKILIKIIWAVVTIFLIAIAMFSGYFLPARIDALRYEIWPQNVKDDPFISQDLEHFPAPTENEEQYLIYLPSQKHENEYEVEIIVGKLETVDAEISCNQMWLGGEFTEGYVEGFGYDYIKFESDGQVASTKMFCPDLAGEEDVEKFVFTTYKTRYNSGLPLVVYTPKDYEVKYKIWSAGETIYDATRQ